MATGEQPVKKRKLYEACPAPPQLAATLSQEEILRKQRNREEIRKLYECYKTIKYCVANKDPRLINEFEQAYLSLITKSRGCPSVQRVVAELIPRYASYCPTALEAAAKVSINMYNWSLASIMRGEDTDGVAYQTAKTCIFGLVDLCCTASFESPTSSVISGICSAVFQSVLTFFTSSFEGRDMCQIVNKEIEKLQEPLELFNNLKEELENDVDPVQHKLLRFGVLGLLRLFFSFPKNLLAACFELLQPGNELHLQKGGEYFLTQVTCSVNVDMAAHAMGKSIDEESPCADADYSKSKFEGKTCLAPESCFLGMVARKDPSLKRWILSKYKKTSRSLDPGSASDICLFLKNVFGSILELDQEVNFQSSDDDELDQFNLIDKISSRPGKEASSTDTVPSLGLSQISNFVGKEEKHAADNSKLQDETSHVVIDAVNLKKLAISDDVDSCRDQPLNNNIVNKQQLATPFTGKQSDIRLDFKKDSGFTIEKSHELNSGVQPSKSAPRIASSGSLSLDMNSAAKCQASPHQFVWYIDGDPLTMDIFSASKQLWLGSLGPDASETSIKLRFEEFGPLEKIMFLHSKGFAVLEYRNVIDAVRARHYMKGSQSWRGCLNVKFLDVCLGTRGAVDGVALGESCHVYIQKVPNKWAKDEIINVLLTRGLRSRMITDFTNEGALLVEFGTAEEAVLAMIHLRKQRKESGGHISSIKQAGSCIKDDMRPSEVVQYHEEEKCPQFKSNNFSMYIPSKTDVCFAGLENRQGSDHNSSFDNKADGSFNEQVSLKVKMESGPQAQSANAFQPNRGASSGAIMQDFGTRKADNYGHEPYAGEPMWQYMEPQVTAQGSVPCPAVSTYCHPVPLTPTKVPFIPPNSFTGNSPWNNCSANPSLNTNISVAMSLHDGRHVNTRPTLPYIPSSVTPISQLQGSYMHCFDPMSRAPALPSISPPPPLPTISPPPPPPPDVPPPLPSSPPPLPSSHPPTVPPPPNSPPPHQPATETLSLCNWKGTLSKSGIHYCIISARRENSSVCNNPHTVSEALDWPSRLDVTKRTDIQHVKTTFANTASHKREVCRLLPSSTNDRKGMHDFSSYLTQKECAGVIKIPAGKSSPGRILFILPHTADTCSMLSIPPDPSECLIALILPKDMEH